MYCIGEIDFVFHLISFFTLLQKSSRQFLTDSQAFSRRPFLTDSQGL